MYSNSYNMPININPMYRNNDNYVTYENYPMDDRFFLAPFLIGGLAGGALGYGIANNNQLNNNGGCCQGGMFYPIVPTYPMPYSNLYPTNSTNNNFYY